MANRLTDFRQRIERQSRGARAALVIGMVALLGVVGLAVPTLQAAVGELVTMVITWAVLLFALYVAYAAVRPLIDGWLGTPSGRQVSSRRPTLNSS